MVIYVPNFSLRYIWTNGLFESKKVPKILILTQGKSGSSFLGTLMSASRNALYIFEPFMKVV